MSIRASDGPAGSGGGRGGVNPGLQASQVAVSSLQTVGMSGLTSRLVRIHDELVVVFFFLMN